MVDVTAALARWTTAFAADADAVGATYAEEATSTALDGRIELVGRDALVADAARFARQAPDRRWITGIALTEETTGRIVVEGEVTGRGIEDVVTMTTPALRWWRLDGSGAIAEERWWFEWSARRIREPLLDLAGRPSSAPPAPRSGTTHSLGWYRDLAERFAETWAWEPLLAVRALYADDAVVTEIKRPDVPLVGLAAIEALEEDRLSRLPRPHRAMTVLDVVGNGSLMAMLLEVQGRLLPPPGAAWGEPLTWLAAVVLTLDENDRASAARWYVDWRELW